jgi:hypothetical protein
MAGEISEVVRELLAHLVVHRELLEQLLLVLAVLVDPPPNRALFGLEGHLVVETNAQTLQIAIGRQRSGHRTLALLSSKRPDAIDLHRVTETAARTLLRAAGLAR